MTPTDKQVQLQLYQTMMDRLPEGLVFVDSKYQIRFWNRTAEALFDVGHGDFAEHPAVKRHAIPTPAELRKLQTASLQETSGQISICSTIDLQTPIDRVIELIETCGQQWVLVRFKQDLLHKRSESELLLLARTDHLSGLLNRRGFQSALEDNLDRQLALAIVDVDFFKRINDKQGHEMGDRAIQWIAEMLTENFPDAVCVGRLGGDEFGVVLEVSDRETIANRFRELCQTVNANPIKWYPDGITISIGVAISKSHGVSARELLTVADRAMYQSKNDGRNRSRSVDAPSND